MQGEQQQGGIDKFSGAQQSCHGRVAMRIHQPRYEYVLGKFNILLGYNGRMSLFLTANSCNFFVFDRNHMIIKNEPGWDDGYNPFCVYQYV